MTEVPASLVFVRVVTATFANEVGVLPVWFVVHFSPLLRTTKRPGDWRWASGSNTAGIFVRVLLCALLAALCLNYPIAWSLRYRVPQTPKSLRSENRLVDEVFRLSSHPSRFSAGCFFSLLPSLTAWFTMLPALKRRKAGEVNRNR